MGGAMILLLLLPVFVMVTEHDLATGIYVRVSLRHHSGPDDICLAGPIVVTISQNGSVSRLLLNGTEVSREEFERALKSKLAERANWEAFAEGDDSVSLADSMYAIERIDALHAQAVILTPSWLSRRTGRHLKCGGHDGDRIRNLPVNSRAVQRLESNPPCSKPRAMSFGDKAYMNPINRPAATMPIHNRIEMKPATFAPQGMSSVSSQVATFR